MRHASLPGSANAPSTYAVPLWAQIAMALLKAHGRETAPDTAILAGIGEEDGCVLSMLRIKRIDSLYYHARPCPMVSPQQTLYDKIWAVQERALAAAIRAIEAAGLPVLVFKGAEMLALYAPCRTRAVSLMSDLDLLVPRRDLAKITRLLNDDGYVQGVVDPERGTIAEAHADQHRFYENHHYELHPFVRLDPIDLSSQEVEVIARLPRRTQLVGREGKWHLIVKLDVHHNVSLDMEVEQFFRRAIPSHLGYGLTLGPADHLWVMVSRYYMEVAIHRKYRLRDLVFFMTMLRRLAIDWDLVVERCRHYRLYPSLFYMLSFLDQLSGTVIPTGVLAEMSPRKDDREHDWGWQIGALFEFIETPPSIIS